MDLFMKSTAILSDCGRYRYRLDRRWGDGPIMGFIMLNPSTADAEKDDRTIGRCISFAKRASCGGIIVLNLFAYRATKPADLWRLRPADRYGDHSVHFEAALGEIDGPLVAAWGGDVARHDPEIVQDVLRHLGSRLLCLGKTKDGHPRHPLYVQGDAPLVPLVPPPAGGTAKSEPRKKCRVCRGWGYIPCDCWPGDCICGFGDEECEACDGTGDVLPDEDDCYDWEWDEFLTSREAAP